ncbi:hypothetical protein DSO57_1034394 [Entomophthora muscae]|uniref:Uncharacterized protein n=1 Tax=Entomophthora muscae TaxID=34485 RepID=A0ACC2SCG7_9FUNG|nr:hypothetical protein DSO57_1034394 [Entomophthora muscae]
MGSFYTKEAVSNCSNPDSPMVKWTPSDKASSQMELFRSWINQRYSLNLGSYPELYDWSITSISDFWAAVWEYTKIISSQSWEGDVVDENASISELPTWFKGARLNFAENLLWCRSSEKVAIYATGEHSEFNLQPRIQAITYQELYSRVEAMAGALRAVGVQEGDRVAGYMPNCPEAIVAMLASASIGAIWSSTSPDFGTNGVLDRFSQIEPKVLFSINAIAYNGRLHDHLSKLSSVVQGLSSLKRVVVFPFIPSHSMDLSFSSLAMDHETFISTSDCLPLSFAQLPFDHPLYILFSSGTTGKPKCLVHTAGGMLIQHKKEHIIHGNLSEKDVVFQYTTTGWMMWNWLVSVLSIGATIVLYDGSPFKPSPLALFELVDELNITAFGTSAKYIQAVEEAGVKPNEKLRLTTLHSLYSTGSPLKPESFDFVYSSIKNDICLGSITGGTDICSLFAGHNTALPVYRGEIQCRCLGMAIASWNDSCQPVFDQSGDLVCTRPFPCMPAMFWNDKDGSKYRGAYFDTFPGVWYHGDFVSINSKTGGVVMLGRSDGTLNPSGVRFGSAEIYNTIEGFEEIEDSVVVRCNSLFCLKIPRWDKKSPMMKESCYF